MGFCLGPQLSVGVLVNYSFGQVLERETEGEDTEETDREGRFSPQSDASFFKENTMGKLDLHKLQYGVEACSGYIFMAFSKQGEKTQLHTHKTKNNSSWTDLSQDMSCLMYPVITLVVRLFSVF